MLCKYGYREYNKGKLGLFQCEVEDFREFFKKVDKDMIVWLVVLLDNGICWVYSGSWGNSKKVWRSFGSKDKKNGEFTFNKLWGK